MKAAFRTPDFLKYIVIAKETAGDMQQQSPPDNASEGLADEVQRVVREDESPGVVNGAADDNRDLSASELLMNHVDENLVDNEETTTEAAVAASARQKYLENEPNSTCEVDSSGEKAQRTSNKTPTLSDGACTREEDQISENLTVNSLAYAAVNSAEIPSSEQETTTQTEHVNDGHKSEGNNPSSLSNHETEVSAASGTTETAYDADADADGEEDQKIQSLSTAASTSQHSQGVPFSGQSRLSKNSSVPNVAQHQQIEQPPMAEATVLDVVVVEADDNIDNQGDGDRQSWYGSPKERVAIVRAHPLQIQYGDEDIAAHSHPQIAPAHNANQETSGGEIEDSALPSIVQPAPLQVHYDEPLPLSNTQPGLQSVGSENTDSTELRNRHKIKESSCLRRHLKLLVLLIVTLCIGIGVGGRIAFKRLSDVMDEDEEEIEPDPGVMDRRRMHFAVQWGNIVAGCTTPSLETPVYIECHNSERLTLLSSWNVECDTPVGPGSKTQISCRASEVFDFEQPTEFVGVPPYASLFSPPTYNITKGWALIACDSPTDSLRTIMLDPPQLSTTITVEDNPWYQDNATMCPHLWYTEPLLNNSGTADKYFGGVVSAYSSTLHFCNRKEMSDDDVNEVAFSPCSQSFAFSYYDEGALSHRPRSQFCGARDTCAIVARNCPFSSTNEITPSGGGSCDELICKPDEVQVDTYFEFHDSACSVPVSVDGDYESSSDKEFWTIPYMELVLEPFVIRTDDLLAATNEDLILDFQ